MTATAVQPALIEPSAVVSESVFHGPDWSWGKVTRDKHQRATEALESWHNDAHAGPFRHCYEQPCHLVRQASE